MGIDLNKMKKRKSTSGEQTEHFELGDLVGYSSDRDDDAKGQLPYEKIKHVTAKAVLIATEDGEEIWVPKSQIVDADESCLTVTEWWANENGVGLA